MVFLALVSFAVLAGLGVFCGWAVRVFTKGILPNNVARAVHYAGIVFGAMTGFHNGLVWVDLSTLFADEGSRLIGNTLISIGVMLLGFSWPLRAYVTARILGHWLLAAAIPLLLVVLFH